MTNRDTSGGPRKYRHLVLITRGGGTTPAPALSAVHANVSVLRAGEREALAKLADSFFPTRPRGEIIHS